MTRRDTARGSQARAGGKMDQAIRGLAGVTVAGLAGIAGAISYSHMRVLAEANGQAGWHAHAFPISIRVANDQAVIADLIARVDTRDEVSSRLAPGEYVTLRQRPTLTGVEGRPPQGSRGD